MKVTSHVNERTIALIGAGISNLSCGKLINNANADLLKKKQ